MKEIPHMFGYEYVQGYANAIQDVIRVISEIQNGYEVYISKKRKS